MKEYPILFKPEMVKAILAGRKIMTRRLVKRTALDWLNNAEFVPYFVAHSENGLCPYGYEGDNLWVRETWRPTMNSMPTGWPYDYRATAKEDMVPEEGPWKASIHMPRKACRIILWNEGVRIERLQEITDDDAISEGVLTLPNEPEYQKLFDEAVSKGEKPPLGETPQQKFMRLWISINGLDSWNNNPWVWVIKFAKYDRTQS
jgi:hypothetical protein